MSFVTMMEGHLAWGDKPLLDNADLAVCLLYTSPSPRDRG